MKSNRMLLVGGILAGAAVGALLGVLLAPYKGSAIRRRIVEEGENYMDEFEEKLESVFQEARSKIKQAMHNCEHDKSCACKDNPAYSDSKQD